MPKYIFTILLLAHAVHGYAMCSAEIKRTAPDSRYELLNSDTEVRDRQTNLVWQRCGFGQQLIGGTCSGTPIPINWGSALQTAKNMGGGWRIPDIKELYSLKEPACFPGVNETFFPNAVGVGCGHIYLSSSTAASSSGNVWKYSLEYGLALSTSKDADSCLLLVRSAP